MKKMQAHTILSEPRDKIVVQYIKRQHSCRLDVAKCKNLKWQENNSVKQGFRNTCYATWHHDTCINKFLAVFNKCEHCLKIIKKKIVQCFRQIHKISPIAMGCPFWCLCICVCLLLSFAQEITKIKM